MKIEIIAIGDEILLGDTVNTNASYLSFELKKMGYSVFRHSVVPDDPTFLKEGLEEALERSDLVIATGGLGPTFDDKTKKIVCDLFSLPLEYREDIAKELYSRYSEDKYMQEQAMVPKTAIVLKNEMGTAPGFIVESSQKKALILLPGVPYEMEKMFSSQVTKYLNKHYVLEEKIYQKTVNICLLKEVQVENFLEELRKIDKDIEIGIYPSFADLKVSFKVKEKSKENAFQKIDVLKSKLEEKFKDFIFESPNGQITEAVKNILIERKKTLALAESCSGGALAAELTSLPDTSLYFLGSIVAYSNELKKDILGVLDTTLKEKGAVSIETANEMVKGIFEITKADYVIAISGIAGPGGGSNKRPVGTVAIAIAKRGEQVDSGLIHVSGDRGFVVKYCVNFALSLLWVRIKGNLTYFIK